MNHGSVPRPISVIPKLLSWIFPMALAVSAPANPSGEQVAAGNASFNRSGQLLQVTTGQQNTIINWQSFSIASGETAKFVQPSSSAATLNRVTGGDPSEIYGSLTSNGKIFLLNPNGILVGQSGRIDTAGFLASTLNLSNAEFLARGDMHLSGTSTAGVENRGTIRAVGGDIFLLGAKVSNSGVLSAGQGTVGLGAGNDILLQQAGDERISVRPTISGKIDNSGTIEAVQAELKAHGNLYALAINNTGVIRATGAVNRDGRVILSSQGGSISNAGRISAKNRNGGGGRVRMHGNQVVVSGTVDASGLSAGTVGGTVQITGTNVGIFDAGRVDVSGAAGGGTALIGGGLHGTDSSVSNALHTFVASGASIAADALSTGNGGQVVVWSNDATRFYGSITARGAGLAGNGGFAEVSGKKYLNFKGKADLAGSQGGKAGSLLLDPDYIVIQSGSDENTVALSSTDPMIAFADPPISGTSTLDVSGTGSFAGVGDGTIIELQARHDITINNNFDLADATGNFDVGLSLRAGDNIHVNALVTVSGTGTLTARANDLGGGGSGEGSVIINSGGGFVTESGALTVSGSAVTVNNGGRIASDSGVITVSGSQIQVNSGGNISSAFGDLALLGEVRVNGGGSVSTAGGSVFASGSAISIGGLLSATGGNIELVCSGAITESGPGNIQTNYLTLSSQDGMTLGGPNSVRTLEVVGHGGAAILFSNANARLKIHNVEQVDGGDITVSNTGTLVLPASLSTTGTLTLGGVIITGTTDFGNSTVGFTSRGTLYVGADAANSDLVLVNPLAALGPVNTLGSFNLDTGGAPLIVTGSVSSRGLAINTGTGSLLVEAGGGLNSNSGVMALTSDSLSLSGPVNGYGVARFQTFTPTLNVLLGTAASSGSSTLGDYRLDNTSLSQIGSDFSGVNFGGNGSSQMIFVNTPVEFTSPLLLNAPASGGLVEIDGPLTASGFGSISINAAVINLNASGATITTARQAVTLTGAVWLHDDALIETGGGAFEAYGTINGANNLTVSAGSGRVSLWGASTSQQNGSIGGSAALQSISLLTTGVINLQPDITTTGDQTYGSVGNTHNINRVGNGRSRSFDNGTITFNGALVASPGMRLGISSTGTSGAGSVIFNGPVTFNSAGLSILGDDIQFNGGANSVTGSGPISLGQGSATQTLEVGGNSILGATHIDTTAISAGHGAFTFGSATGGEVVIDNGASFAYPVAFVSGTTVTLAGSLFSSGAISLLGKTNLLSGDITTSNAPITFQAVQLGGNLTVNSGTTNAAVNFLSTVNGTLATPGNLTVSSGTGAITFAGVVGAITPIQGSVELQTAGVASIKAGLSAGSLISGTAVHLGSTALSSTIQTVSGITIGNNATLLGVTSIVAGGDIAFGGSFVGTAATRLTIQTPGDLTQSGVWTLPAAVKLQARDITLSRADNTFGSLQLTGRNVILRENAATDLGASTISGDLSITSSGAITDSGLLAVTGPSVFTTPLTVLLDNSTNAFTGPVTFSSAAANLVNSIDTVVSGGNVTGLLKLQTSGDITVTNTTGRFGTLAMIGRGATVTSGTYLKLAAVTLAGNLDVVASGSITQVAALTVNGLGINTVFSDAGIALDNSANRFGGSISLNTSSGNASLVTAIPAVLAGGTIAGNLYVRSAGAITQSSPLSTSGSAVFLATGALTLNDPNNDLSGVVSLAGSVVSYSGNFSNFGAIRAASLALSVDSHVTQVAPWTVSGITTIDAHSSDISLGLNNTFGTLRLTGNNVNIHETAATDLGLTNVGGNFTVSSSGAITDSGAITVDGVASFSAGTSITLDHSASLYSGPVTLTGGGAGNVTLVNSDSVTLGAIHSGGNLTVRSTGDIVSASGAMDVVGTATLVSSSTGAITLSNAANRIGTLAMAGHDATVITGTSIKLGAITLGGAFSLTASGSIGQIGTLSLGDALTVQNNGNNAPSNLGFTRNSIVGPISISTTGTGAVSLYNTKPITLVSSTVGGSIAIATLGALDLTDAGNSIASYGTLSATALDLVSSRDVVQTGAWRVTGTTSIDAGTHNIDLSALNTFGALSLAGGNITVRESGAVTLAEVAATGNLTVTSTGAGAMISDAGAVTVGGASSFNANSGGVVLDNSANAFNLSIALSASASSTVVNTRSTTLAASTIGGVANLLLTSGGAIAQTGDLSIRGILTMRAGSTIALTSTGNQLTTLGSTISPDSIAIVDSTGGLTISQPVTGLNASISTVGNLTLLSQSYVVGRNVSLAALGGGEFINNSSAVGVGALPGGHYEIYSHDIAGIKKGRLTGLDMSGAFATQPSYGSAVTDAFFYSVAP